MGVVGSIGINIGQNFQAEAIQRIPEEHRKECSRLWSSPLWLLGQVIFATFSLINFAALALAPASVLTPLESIQFVTNIFYNRFVNKAVVSTRMAAGVGLAAMGTTLTVVFGAPGNGCHTVDQLESFWVRWTWPVYVAFSLTVAVVAFVTHKRYQPYVLHLQKLRQELQEARKAGCIGAGHEMELKRLTVELEEHEAVCRAMHAELVAPISYTLYSALIGGAQMIVHTKAVSELLFLLLQGDDTIFVGWLVYAELTLLLVCGFTWLYKLNECLWLYEPLLILPLMVGTFILFGGIAGGIFFQVGGGLLLPVSAHPPARPHCPVISSHAP